MKKIPFVKSTSYGNNFVIVDETRGRVLSEEDKSAFGYQATNTCFGVGSDNLLVVQRCDEETLAEINSYRGYWPALPAIGDADYIFRMFEPDGRESLCCGNGLLCIADYLGRRYQSSAAGIMTEVPLATPNVIALGRSIGGSCWVDLGHPRRTPAQLIDPSALVPLSAQTDLLKPLTVRFRHHDLAPYTEDASVELKGYAVYTGEPHLVVFEDGLSRPELIEPMFLMSREETPGDNIDKRVQFGSWLLHRIGCFLNTKRRDLFPVGVNVNFARVDAPAAQVEYRCFERGIDRETLACGTGALAVACVASELGLVADGRLEVLPHRCRWHQPEARLLVSPRDDGSWLLSGTPELLFEGTYALSSAARARQMHNTSRYISGNIQQPAMPSGNYIAITDDAIAEASINR